MGFFMWFNHDPGFVEGVFFICPTGNLSLSKSERKRGDLNGNLMGFNGIN